MVSDLKEMGAKLWEIVTGIKSSLQSWASCVRETVSWLSFGKHKPLPGP